MIEFKKCFVVNGTAYATIEEARVAILTHLIKNEPPKDTSADCDWAQWIVAHGDFVVDVLTTREGSKPSARKINGGTKKRKAKGPETMADDLKTRDHTP